MMNTHQPTETSLTKPLFKKQDFGGFAHPPYEPNFKHCLLRGKDCSLTATQYISSAKVVIENKMK